MNGHLYFICPTDHLELIIDNAFLGDSYFFTSLGNSMVFDEDLCFEIGNLMELKGIQAITFILSDKNKVIRDALLHQDFSRFGRLKGLYDEITNHKEQSRSQGVQDARIHELALSVHLDSKVKELMMKMPAQNLNIDAKIYGWVSKQFIEVDLNKIKNNRIGLGLN
ncbi:MAG: hypothetical protein P8P48_04275 [Saprospiraceae bacterium]|nr:hypothetical protein [Saprospiraceae bacterium]